MTIFTRFISRVISVFHSFFRFCLPKNIPCWLWQCPMHLLSSQIPTTRQEFLNHPVLWLFSFLNPHSWFSTLDKDKMLQIYVHAQKKTEREIERERRSNTHMHRSLNFSFLFRLTNFGYKAANLGKCSSQIIHIR